jgi:hypothetical protein
MMGRREGGQGQFFYSFDLDKVVPPDHLVRQVEGVLDLSWVHTRHALWFDACATRATRRARAIESHHRGRLLLDQVGAEFCLGDQTFASPRYHHMLRRWESLST